MVLFILGEGVDDVAVKFMFIADRVKVMNGIGEVIDIFFGVLVVLFICEWGMSVGCVVYYCFVVLMFLEICVRYYVVLERDDVVLVVVLIVFLDE